jgi:hemoglobin
MSAMRAKLRRFLLPLVLSCCAMSAQAAAPAPGLQAASLYARMGGAPVVAAVVADTIDGVAADPRLNQSFQGTNLRRVKQKLAEQLCQLAGGGCTYTGDTMRQVHAGHHIGEAEFYGLVEQLRSALRRHGVALRERNELLALLAPMKRDVVNVPVPAPSGPPTSAEEP